MRGKPILLITATCALIAAAAVFLYTTDTEPRYNGRPLAQWIKASSSESGNPEAHEAIVCITTNSVPLLLRWAFADTKPRFHTMPRVSKLIYTLPPSVSFNPFLRHFLYRDKQVSLAACAMRAFEIAGTNAASAVPPLAVMITDPNPEVALQALFMLPLFGPTALPPIRRAMTNQLPYIRCAAIGCLKRFGTNAPQAIPDLVKALCDYDINVRQNATNVLASFYPVALTNTPAQ